MSFWADPTAIYTTPLGRRCTIDPSAGRGGAAGWLAFRYLGPEAAFWGGGFTLAHRNLRLLKRVTPVRIITEAVADAPAR
jgi:hypothetical protein